MNKQTRIRARTAALNQCIAECDQSGEPLSDGLSRRTASGQLLIIHGGDQLTQSGVIMLQTIDSQIAEVGGSMGLVLRELLLAERIALVER